MNNPLRLSICVTTTNAPQDLSNCLQALWNSEVKPQWVVVADDSRDLAIQQTNQELVNKYPQTTYIEGVHRGVCANRNRALQALPPSDLVAFVDDDICVAADFIAKALAKYHSLTPAIAKSTFLTGGNPSKIDFRGYFRPSAKPECVDLHTAVFPTSFFREVVWDEQIFFGYEDALLCLQARQQGYQILHCPELKTLDTRAGKSTLKVGGVGNLDCYEIYIEAARLYLGIQRYKNLFPNPLKLIIFLTIYFMQMTIYLTKNRAFTAWKDILKYSHFTEIWA